MCFCNRCTRRRRRQNYSEPMAMAAVRQAEYFEPAVMQESVDVKEYDCDTEQQVIKHKHIVKHQHDIINEYEIIHEHEYNYHDVVTEREVVKHNDFCKHKAEYCEKPVRQCECYR